MPAPEVARRAWHGVAVLLRRYAGASTATTNSEATASTRRFAATTKPSVSRGGFAGIRRRRWSLRTPTAPSRGHCDGALQGRRAAGAGGNDRHPSAGRTVRSPATPPFGQRSGDPISAPRAHPMASTGPKSPSVGVTASMCWPLSALIRAVARHPATTSRALPSMVSSAASDRPATSSAAKSELSDADRCRAHGNTSSKAASTASTPDLLRDSTEKIRAAVKSLPSTADPRVVRGSSLALTAWSVGFRPPVRDRPRQQRAVPLGGCLA